MRKIFAAPFVWIGVTLLALGTVILYGTGFAHKFLAYVRIATLLAMKEHEGSNLDA